MAFFLDYKILKYSIVNTLENSETKKDSQEPYPFIDFVKNLDIDNIGNEFVVDSYNKYLIEWTKIKNQATESFEEIRKAKYVDLLKNIQLNYLNQDEQRILGNIDFDDPLELDVAIPFFVEKIKDIIEYYINKRRDVKNSKAKWSTKGSKQFLENVTAKYIIDNYTKNENTFQRYKQDYQELSSFQRNYRLKYDGLYDLNDYRAEEFSFDESLFLSSSSDYDLSSLPITSFSDYSQSESTLISELKKDIYKKYISTDRQYFKSGESTDVESTTPFYDPYNYDTPYISRISDTTNLLRDADIGYYFTSKYIYTSNYYSPYGISISNTDNLVGLLPKINVYRSEDYKDYYFWSKYNATYQGLVGKPVFDKRLKRFYGYQSRDLNLDDSVGGVEKYTDNIQLWTGNKNETWANEDIFDKFSDNILNRDLKNEFHFTLDEDESVYKYVCDIYGNQYYLIKKINTPKSASQNVYTLNTTNVDDSLAISNISILGQRFSALDSLTAIQIQENVALGFYITTIDISQEVIEIIDDFNVIDIGYYDLLSSNTLFDTESISSDEYDSQKSLYENQYTVGKLYVRDVNNKYVKNINDFLDDELSSLINVDVINDFVIFTTENNFYTSKIKYDYSSSEINFQQINKNLLSSYNEPLVKSSSYWYETNSESVYFADINHTLSSYDLYYIETETNTKTTYNIETETNIDYDLGNIISITNISKPQLIKNDNFLYLIVLLSDTCNNYYYQIIVYEIISKNNLTTISNTVYHPSNLSITSSLTSDSFALSTTELSSYNLSSFPLSSIYRWNNNLSSQEIFDLPYLLSSDDVTYYDNDSGTITISKPPTKYYLSDLIDGITPTLNITTTEDSYSYVGDYIYTPVDVIIDFREIPNLSSYVTNNEPIYKIEYFINGKIKSSFILDTNNIETDVLSSYNTSFLTSPINMEYISFKNDNVNFSIKFYSLSGKSFRFDFNFTGLNFALSEKYAKVELLDARIRTTETDQLDCLLYLNTRKPDSIINTSLLNI